MRFLDKQHRQRVRSVVRDVVVLGALFALVVLIAAAFSVAEWVVLTWR